MTIFFDKINQTAKPIELSSQGILLDGTLQKSGYHRVTLDANISGNIELCCDRCGDMFEYIVDSKLTLKLSDLISEDKVDLDIIEFLDGKIDVLYILDSEITTLKSNYNYCTKCDNNEEAFEMEF